KNLLIDIAMFTISNFGSKVMVFLMVPLYTHVLAAEEYAIADLVTGTINILLPVMTLAITEATLRFLLDENFEKGKILGASLLFIGISTLLLVAATPLSGYLNEKIGDYWGYFLVMYLTTALNGCMSNYIRGIDKTRLFAMKGVLHTMLLVALNLLMLLGFQLGLQGYLLAIILSDSLALLYMVAGCRLWKIIPTIRLDRDVIRQMLKYSIPMIPTIIAWWVMQISDKYVLIAYSGLAVSGIYSVAYRIPSVLAIVSSVFNQAWQISAVKSMSDDDYTQYVIRVYRYFFAISLGLCGVLIACSQIIGSFMFQGDYYIAWKYVPVLLLAYFLSGLSGVMASIFTTMKRTSVLLYSTVCAAAVNLVLNFLLIPQYGAMAAAATTAIGFFVTFVVRTFCTKKFFGISLNSGREIAMVLLLVLQAVVTSADATFKHPVSAVCLLIMVAVYFREIVVFVKKLKTLPKKMNGGRNA
ncbi:MAG: polysaccharide biosynthesis C-terminal domain-containing protein, partial [Acinetobacter sp.]